MLSNPPTSFSLTITKHLSFLHIPHLRCFFHPLFSHKSIFFFLSLKSFLHSSIPLSYLSLSLFLHYSLSQTHSYTHHPNSILIRSMSFLKELVSSKSSLLRFSALRLPDFYPLHVASIWNSSSPGHKFLHCHTLKRSDNQIPLCAHI